MFTQNRWKMAVGLINRGAATASISLKWADLKLTGKQVARDLCAKKPDVFDQQFSSPVAPGGVVLLRVNPEKYSYIINIKK